MEKEIFKFEITEDDEGKRLDKFLVERLPAKHSRAFIQRLISDGDVRVGPIGGGLSGGVGGESVKCHHRTRAGELVMVTVSAPKESAIKSEEIPLNVVYEDDHVIIVDKSAEMVVHPAPGNYSGTLVNALLGRCKNLSGIGGVLKPGIVHRIDRGTSGLLVAAKTDQAHQALAEQFKDKSVKRVYVALVKGVVQLDNGIIELPIGRSIRDRKKMAVKFDDSRAALTRYKVLERFKNSTLLELTLGTGRTHQIRVHMSYVGHPLVGDDKYGVKSELGRPALHAKTLGFIHPTTKKYMEFTSDLPSDMKELILRQKLSINPEDLSKG